MKTILIVVFTITLILLGGVFGYHTFIAVPRMQKEQQVLREYNFPDSMNNAKTSPSQGFPVVQDQLNTQSDIDALLTSLDEPVEDDGGIKQLEAEIEEL
ncbi:MAG: hypothetical protein N3A54_04215 [Patescibacteria group bacterium]|nr:hypothetical protein [Patescibacteria group bacterium]